MKLFCWHRFIVFSPVRTLLLSAVVLLSVLTLSFLIGCSKVSRHKILTFFFDGVPPLPLEYLDPNSPDYQSQVKKLEEVSTSSRHKSGKGCWDYCHFRGVGKLDKPVPVLCYSCHDDYTEQGIYVHAPIRVGDCLFCHESHESLNPFLLKNSIPDLCFKCHDRKAVVLIEKHDDPKYGSCSSCHASHVTSNRYLLKGGDRPPNSSAENMKSTSEISDPNAIHQNNNETDDKSSGRPAESSLEKKISTPEISDPNTIQGNNNETDINSN